MMKLLSSSSAQTKKTVALITALFVTQSNLPLQADAIPTITTLNGHSFNCDGLNIGFDSKDIFCGGSAATAYKCGSYTFENGLLNGDIDDVETGNTMWTARNVAIRDDILVSFSLSYIDKTTSFEAQKNSSNEDDDAMKCYVTSQSWRKFSAVVYRVDCPWQRDTSESIEIEFGKTGDVAFRSEVPMKSSPGDKIATDYYGVYVWREDGSLTMYFGPQKGHPETVINGKMSDDGVVYLDGYDPSGPCQNDGSEEEMKDVVSELPHGGGMAMVSAVWLPISFLLIKILL
mmetsp:Transcript_14243/g.17946  ORF Transcript_14243/g.17946 Transcript_14243/m.17946 type:complete len:288 (+) Transcript_14243:57-920(+)